MMSIGLLLRDRDAAVIWRGPLKMSAIKQFLEEVEWGELDYLIIDAPPGTGDEPLSVCQLAAPLTGAVVVTTPQDVATADVRRSITFCRQLDLPVLGVVENMSGFVCPHCNTVTEIFKSGGGERMAESMGCPSWDDPPRSGHRRLLRRRQAVCVSLQQDRYSQGFRPHHASDPRADGWCKRVRA